MMYRDTFGGEATVLDELHDYMAEVNAKWGLEHGEPVSVTGNRHITREEYYAMLGHEIQEREEKKSKLESAIKGLGTMIHHLTTERDECTAEIEELEEQLAQCQGDKSEIEAKIEALKARVSDLDARLADKRTKLMEADRKLKEANIRVRDAVTNFENMEKANAIVQEELGKDVDLLFKTTFFDDAVDGVKTMFSNNPDLKLGDKAEVLNAMFYAGAEHMVEVVDKAKELFLAGINGAANAPLQVVVAVAVQATCFGETRTRILPSTFFVACRLLADRFVPSMPSRSINQGVHNCHFLHRSVTFHFAGCHASFFCSVVADKVF